MSLRAVVSAFTALSVLAAAPPTAWESRARARSAASRSAAASFSLDARGRARAAAEVPPVALSGFVRPTSVTHNADGTLVYVSEKAGVIKLLKFAPGAAWHGSGAPASTVVKDISATVSSHGDHGISCIWLASTGDFLYTTHMKVDARWGPTGCVDSGIPDNRALNTIAGCNVYGVLSRFPVAADGALGDEQVIYDTQDAVHLDAGGVDRGNGCVQFSTHSVPVAVTEQGGFLFVSHGDGAGFSMVDAGQLGVDQGGCNDNPGYRGAFRSQDPHRLNGKILRWTVGATPADFSFVVWSSGHRNPFRLSPDPARDRILQSETGWYLVEEINLIDTTPAGQGKNRGWPCFEGPVVTPEYVNFIAPLGVVGSDGVPGALPNTYCAGVANTLDYFYYHPPAGPLNTASISAVAAFNDRIYYGDISEAWIKSIPATRPAGPGGAIDLSGPGTAEGAAAPAPADVRVEMTNVGPVQLVASPRGLIYIDHFMGTISSVVAQVPPAPAPGAPPPSPSPAPPAAFVAISAPAAHEWAAGSGGVLTLTATTNVAGYGATAGREGTAFAWTATFLACAAPGGATCTATPIANLVAGGAALALPVPPVPGTLEVVITASTAAGSAATATTYLTASAAAAECTCPGARTALDGFPAPAAPAPAPAPGAAPGAAPASKPAPAVDTRAPAFIAGVSVGAAALAVALAAAGAVARARARGGLSSSAASAEHPFAAAAVGRAPSTESEGSARAAAAAASAGSGGRGGKGGRSKAAFAPAVAGAGTGIAPNFISPTASARPV